METLEFGKTLKTSNDYIEEIQTVLGVNCPITVTVVDGVLKYVSIDTEWPEGGTTAIEAEVDVEKIVEVPDVRIEQYEEEMVDDKGEKIILPDGSIAKETKTVEVPFVRYETVTEKEIRVVDYEENYVEKSLTQQQIDALNVYIEENIQ